MKKSDVKEVQEFFNLDFQKKKDEALDNVINYLSKKHNVIIKLKNNFSLEISGDNKESINNCEKDVEEIFNIKL